MEPPWRSKPRRQRKPVWGFSVVVEAPIDPSLIHFREEALLALIGYQVIVGAVFDDDYRYSVL